MMSLNEALDSKRSVIDRKVTNHREQRDKHNISVRTHLDRRNELNQQVASLIEEARRQRVVRDEKNELVRSAKEIRARCNEKVRTVKEGLSEIQKEGSSVEQKGPPLHHLKKDLSRLEREIEVGKHQGKNERKALDQMKEIARKIQIIENEQSSDSQSGQLFRDLTEAQKEQEDAHNSVTLAADQAQEAHDLMVRIHKEVDRLREEADQSQRDLLESKRKADRNHRAFVMSIRSLHSIQDMLSVQGDRTHYEEKEGERVKQREEVDDIMDRLLRGETVDTDELLALQRHES